MKILILFYVLFLFIISTLDATAKNLVTPEPKEDAYTHIEGLVQDSNFGAAIQEATEYLKSHAESPWAWRKYVLVKWLSKDINSLRPSLLEMEPKSPPGRVLFARGYLEYLLKNWADSYLFLKQSITVGFNEPIVLNALGVVASELGNLEESLDYFHKALRLDPTLLMAKTNLSRILAKKLTIKAQAGLAKSVSDRQNLVMSLEQEAFAERAAGDLEIKLKYFKVIYIDKVFGNKSFVIVASETEAGGQLTITSYKNGQFDYSHQQEYRPWYGSDWTVSEKYKDKILLIQYTGFSGPHHYDSTVYYLSDDEQLFYLSHHGESTAAIEIGDVDNDGWPELTLDYSEYYISSYAEGIIDFFYLFCRFNQNDKHFECRPLAVQIDYLDEKTEELNAQAIAYAAEGRWQTANKLIDEAIRNNPENKELKWNQVQINFHLRKFEEQYHNKPNIVTAALLGNSEYQTKFTQWHGEFGELLSTIPIVRMSEQILKENIPLPARNFLSKTIYERGRTLNDVTISDGVITGLYSLYSQKSSISPKQLFPEVRSLENGIFSFLSNTLVYIPPQADASIGKQLLSSQQPEQAWHNLHLDEKYFKDSQEFFTAQGSYTGWNWPFEIDNGMPPKFNEIVHLIRKEDFEQAEEQIQSALSRFPEYNGNFRMLQQAIDLRFGRYTSVLDPPLLRSFYSAIAYEHLGNYDEAKNLLQELLTSPNGTSVEKTLAQFGLGRIEFAKGHYDRAMKEFRKAENDYYKAVIKSRKIQINDDELPDFDTLLMWMSKTSLAMGKLQISKAYNALAIQASSRSIQPREYVTRQHFFRFELLPMLFYNEFHIAMAESNKRLALAYLAASLSIVRDIYTVTNQEKYRFGLNESAGYIFREAVEFELHENNETKALELLNSMKETTFLANYLRQSKAQKTDLAGGGKIAVEKALTFSRETSATIIQYFVTELGTTIFLVLPNGEIAAVPTDATQSWLEKEISKMQDNLLSLDREVEAAKAVVQIQLKKLYAMLIAPIQNKLTAQSHLVIIPDGPLFRIPFSALVDFHDHYLIQNYSLTFAGSLRSLETWNASLRGSDMENILIVHSPALDVPLIHAREEATIIMNILGRRNTMELYGRELTKENLKTAVRDKTIVHFATHSEIDAQEPRRSKIILGQHDGQSSELTLDDLMSGEIHLEASPLVVLSSCSSAIGKGYEEGSYGLVQGLLRAGASSAIATLWEIEDSNAPIFMQEFYKQYSKDHNAPLALYRTQATLIEQKYPPYVWAPYQHYGRFYH